jgi:hypothetical protein
MLGDRFWTRWIFAFVFIRFSAWIVAGLMVGITPVLAGPTADMCDRAARVAARDHGIPPSVLLAITRVETGRTRSGDLTPWPWTINMEGKGRWFDTEDQARAYVFKHFKAGARSFDVGCFQINYKWHSHAFRSIDEMFDPALGADYAARFLKKLHAEFGDWTKAAGAYHSRTPVYAKRYAAKYDQVVANLPVSRAVSVAGQPLFSAARPLVDGAGKSGSAPLGSVAFLRD